MSLDLSPATWSRRFRAMLALLAATLVRSRVTAAPDDLTSAMNLTEVIRRSPEPALVTQ